MSAWRAFLTLIRGRWKSTHQIILIDEDIRVGGGQLARLLDPSSSYQLLTLLIGDDRRLICGRCDSQLWCRFFGGEYCVDEFNFLNVILQLSGELHDLHVAERAPNLRLR